MSISDHNCFCHLLAISKSAARSGLLSVLLGTFASRGLGAVTGDQLVEVVVRAILSNRNLFEGAFNERTSLECPSVLARGAAGAPPCLIYLNDKCSIRHSALGRCIVSEGGALCAGEEVLSEAASYVVPSSSCGCSASGVLLKEHVQLAWILGMAPRSDACGSGWTDCLCSGFADPIMLSGEADAFVPNQWPLHVLLLMAVISSVCAVVLLRDSTTAEITKVAASMFRIIAKLPQNTHSVHLVSSKNLHGTMEEVSHLRVGISLFATASAMNHSCNPNCVVTYTRKTSENESHGEQEYRLEVRAHRRISPGEECTISYGVALGSSPYQERQTILKKQYLFRCRCDACGSQSRNLATRRSGEDSAASRHASLLQQDCAGAHAAICKFQMEMRSTNSSDFEMFKRELSATISRMKQNFEYVAGIESIQEAWRIKMTRLECEFLDACAFHESFHGNYLVAASLVEEAIQLMLVNGIYTRQDAPIGREYVKLCELFAMGGEGEEAERCARAAYACLRLQVGQWDPDLSALTSSFPALLSLS